MLHSGRCWPYLQTLTRLEMLARDKHSSLLQKSVNYDCKKFYSTGPRCEVHQVQSTINKSADTISLQSTRLHCGLNVLLITMRALEVQTKNTADLMTSNYFCRTILNFLWPYLIPCHNKLESLSLSVISTLV